MNKLEGHEGYDEIVIKKIENDKIYVVKVPYPNLTFTDANFPDGGKELGKVQIEIDKICAVLVDSLWHRCKIELDRSDHCKVFLIDLGHSHYAKKQYLRRLPKKFSLVDAQVFPIQLYGIKPVGKVIEGSEVHKTICHKWEQFHVTYFNMVFQNAEKIYFKEVTKFNDVSYGIVLIKKDASYVKLNEVLCNLNLATENIDLDYNSDSSVDQSNVSEDYQVSFPSDKNAEKSLENKKAVVSGSIFPGNRQDLLKISFGDRADLSVINKSYRVKSPRLKEYTDSYVSSANNSSNEESFELNSSNQSDETVIMPRIVKERGQRPMSQRVLSLYEQTAEESRRLKKAAELDSSNRGSDNEVKIKKKEYVKSLYGNCLLHQSPSIEEIVPCERLIDSGISAEIHKVLEIKQRKDLTQLQTYAYPILTKRHNLLIVSNNHSGKTLACVVALLTVVGDEEFYKDLKGYGPKLIFLTSVSKHLDLIMKMCQTLLSNDRVLNVQKIYSWETIMEMTVKLAPGCDVLITTPKCLNRMLEEQYILDVERLCHIVFDDADFVFDNSLKEVQSILTLINKLEERRGNSKYNVQKVVLAKKWSGILDWFVKSVMINGFICITEHNLLEGAVYAKIKPIVEIVKQENKINLLTGMLSSLKNTARTVIVCNTAKAAIELKVLLDPHCERLLIAHDDFDHIKLSSTRISWHTDVDEIHQVMLCTDGVLTELDITNADNLIHYQLPLSKISFSSRFVCLLQKYPNIFFKNTVPKCKVHIFVDEDNDQQFPELVDYMKRFKLKVSDEIQNVAKRINDRKEKDKKTKMLCETFKQYGSCWRISKCFFRHVFLPEVDEVKGVPKTGFVKIRVTSQHDVSHLSVILLEHKVMNKWVKLPYSDQTLVIALKMNSYFSNESNRNLHVRPRIGDLVAVEQDNVFYRASIIYINKLLGVYTVTLKICVKLLEIGDVINIKSTDLYYLPDDLKKIPPQAVDVYLCDVQPIDEDHCWSDAAYNHLKRLLSQAKNAIEDFGDSHYLCGRIVLSVGRNLWLDPLTHSEKLESAGVEVYISSLKHEILDRKMAIVKSDHMTLLNKMCKEAGIKLPINVTQHPVKKGESSVNVQWAHLDSEEFQVVFVANQNPDRVFLRRTEFLVRLEELQKEIDKLENKKPIQKNDLAVGDICLAYNSDENSWNRAKVIKFHSSNNVDEVEVFFADYGDYGSLLWDQLAKIPVHLITKLPLQSIECRLAGIRAINEKDGWSEKATSLLYDLSELENGSWKAIVVRVLNIDLKAEVTGGRRYTVALLDVQTNPIILLNKELVIQGEANWLMDEKSWLDDICNEYEAFASKQSDQISNREESFDSSDYKQNSEYKEDSDVNSNERANKMNFNQSNNEAKYPPSSLVDQNLNELFNSLDVDDDDCFEVINMKKIAQDMLNWNVPQNILDKIDPPVLALPETESHKLPNTPSSTTTEEVSSIDKERESSIKEEVASNLGLFSMAHRKRQNKKFGNLQTDTATISKTDDIKTLVPVNDRVGQEVVDVIPYKLVPVEPYRTPVVQWFQNKFYVWLRILVTDVKHYDLYISNRALLFRCKNKNGDEGDFLLTLHLYGLIIADTIQHSAQGFYVSVRMTKTLEGVNWPRLLISETNYNWVKVDPGHIGDGYEHDSDNETDTRIILPVDESDSTNSSDVEEPGDCEIDPYDPFHLG